MRKRRAYTTLEKIVLVTVVVILALMALFIYANRDYWLSQKPQPASSNTFSASTGMYLYMGADGSHLVYGGMDGNSTVIIYTTMFNNGYSYALRVRLGEGFQIEEMHQYFRVTYATPSQVTIEKREVLLVRGYPGP